MIENKIIEIQKAKIFEGLNEEQTEALYYFDGPLRIIAGAGSGKTRVLTRKIAYLINVLGISPNHILAVTFTNKGCLLKCLKELSNTQILNLTRAQLKFQHSIHFVQEF
nr:UvrD-helicase domain-containing protein [Mycoplasmopsis bovis]